MALGSVGHALLIAIVGWQNVSALGGGDVYGVLRVAGSETPSAGVSVRVGTQIVYTDTLGRFRLPSLPVGQYDVLIGAEGPKRVIPVLVNRRLRVDVRAETATELDVRVIIPATIAGRVGRTDGKPIFVPQLPVLGGTAGVTVSATRSHYKNGRMYLDVAASTRTNDRGEYRLFGLEPGAYIIRVESNPGNGVLTSYFPGTTDYRQAQEIVVVPGEEITRIDFNVALTANAVISGRILNWSDVGQLLGSFDRISVQFQLLSRNLDVPQEERVSLNKWDRSSGEFGLDSNAVGEYFLHVIVLDRLDGRFVGSPKFYYTGYAAVNLGQGNRDTIAITLKETSALQGQVSVDGGTDLTLSTVRLGTQPISRVGDEPFPAAGFNVTISPEPSGVFTLRSLPPGRYSIDLQGVAPHWCISGIRQGSEDLQPRFFSVSSKAPALQVVVSSTCFSLSGTVRNRAGDLLTNTNVVLVPTTSGSPDRSLYQETVTDVAGRFVFTRLLSGEYFVLAGRNFARRLYESDSFKPEPSDNAITVVFPGNVLDHDISIIAAEDPN